MTAHLVAFDTRAEVGLRKARSVSYNVDPERGGVALHYGGPAARVDGHDECRRLWRGWQAYHMDDNGWADVAYTLGVCDHGHVLAGRGYGVRTAAQGTNDGNQRFLAVCWLGGEGERPTDLALDAIEWAVGELRRQGAGMAVRPHRAFHSTSCPGGTLVQLAQELDGRQVTTGPVTPPAPPTTGTTTAGGYAMPATVRPGDEGRQVSKLQGLLRAHGHKIAQDGDYKAGGETERAVRAHQRAWGIGVDGLVGPETWRTLIEG